MKVGDQVRIALKLRRDWCRQLNGVVTTKHRAALVSGAVGQIESLSRFGNGDEYADVIWLHMDGTLAYYLNRLTVVE